jgi:hypothetical protein
MIKMNTFRYRIKFLVHFPGKIRDDEIKIAYKLSNNTSLSLSSYNGEKITESTTFVISGGGFSSEEEAFDQGRKIKKSLLISGPILGIGIDAGKDQCGSSMSTGMKNSMFEKTGVKIIEDVHGLSVYSEEYPTQVLSFSGSGVVQSWTANQFIETIECISNNLLELTDKEILCLELYGASHFESSVRASFLTLVLAIESLLEPAKRSEETIKHVDLLIKLTNDYCSLSSAEKSSINGSLQWLYQDSISKSLKKLALKYLQHKEYSGLSSQKFISKCYELRSNLVHSGKLKDEKVNLSVYTSQLNVFLSDLLQEKIGINLNTLSPSLYTGKTNI